MTLNIKECKRIAAEITIAETKNPTFDVWSPRRTLPALLVLPDPQRIEFPESALPFVFNERLRELNVWLPQEGRVLVTNNPSYDPIPPKPGFKDAGFTVVDVTIPDYLELDELQQLFERFGRAFGIASDPVTRL